MSNSAVARRAHEGLSLFSLVSHTCTPQGNSLLRQWFLTPLQSVEEICERQDAVAFFLSGENRDAVKGMRGSLKKAGDVHTALRSIRRGGKLHVILPAEIGAKRMVGKKQSGATEWKALLEVLPSSQLTSSASTPSRYTISSENSLPTTSPFSKRSSLVVFIYRQLIATLNPGQLTEVTNLITSIVDFDSSSLEARFIVKLGVDAEVTPAPPPLTLS
jgi:MutS domain III